MARGFLYLVAVMDWFSRRVLSWRLSNTLDAVFRIDALEEALSCFERPAIFNTDQGSQFTSRAFTGTLEERGVAISMDGRGRCMDNIFIERLWRSLKYEEVYLKAYDDGTEARAGIGAWLGFYNEERLHQALGYLTPDEVFHRATRPVDKWIAAARLPTSPQAQQQQEGFHTNLEESLLPSPPEGHAQEVEIGIQVSGSLP